MSMRIYTSFFTSVIWMVSFFLFKSNSHLKYFQGFPNSCHINMLFPRKQKREVEVEVLPKKGKFITHKPSFVTYKNFFHPLLIFLSGIHSMQG